MDNGIRFKRSAGHIPFMLPDIEFVNRTAQILNQIPGSMGMSAPKDLKPAMEALEKHFKSLPPHMKKFIYQQLTQDGGSLKSQFQRVPEFDRNDLLKLLNPKHVPALPAKDSEAIAMQRLQKEMDSLGEMFKLADEEMKRKLQAELDRKLKNEPMSQEEIKGTFDAQDADKVNKDLKGKP